MLRQRFILALILAAFCGVVGSARSAPDLSRYEGRNVASVEVAFEGVPRDGAAEAELRALVAVAPGAPFAAVRVRESLQALFDSGRVANARVEAAEAAGGAVALRFLVRPQVRVADVRVELVGLPPGAPVAADELRARLNLLEAGARVSDQALRSNADAIQAYLRDRGFFGADVSFAQEVNAAGTGATITFRVTPGEQARVEAFNIDVKGFDDARVRPQLRLASGGPFTRAALGEDVGRVRRAVMAEGYLAPQLDEPQVVINSERNTITVNLRGGVGPRVNVTVADYELGEKTARELLPVKREGTIDAAAIEEGGRRLRNRLQEEGYFFADVTATCAVDAPANPAAAPAPQATNEPGPQAEGTDVTCQNLNPRELNGRTVNIAYRIERGRRFRLADIRIEGTQVITPDDVADELRSEEASLLGIIPFAGSRRGYTSRELLERDRNTIATRMRELGYRRARVEVRQGISLDSEDLIITFAVTEGPLTRVAGVDVRGNQIYEAERLRDEPCRAAGLRGEPCTVVGGAYSRSLARSDADRIRTLYARNGYVDAEVRADVVELPPNAQGDEQVRIVYNVTEGGKVFVNRIIINGNEGTAPDARMLTKRRAILEAIPVREGKELRADDLTESERVLLETNAFRQVVIRTEAAGETAAGFRRRDVIIDVEEFRPRRMDYGGGFSTENGPTGLFELQNNNLFGELKQGTLRARGSRRQQLLRLEFFDPRFRSYSQTKFSPLSVSAQYQRDVSVTRFFRSTIDEGNFGIVQRLDPEGRPILVNCTLPEAQCERTGEPAINRFTFNVESQRVLEQRSRTILFVRYSYEDVRLFNIGSLLVAPILEPDRVVRLSRFGATLTRDTRDRQFDPTRGQFFTLDYAVAIKQLGGNLSFSKLQATYRRYYRLGGGGQAAAGVQDVLDRRNRQPGLVRGTVFAFSAQLGLANLFNPRDRNENGVIDDIDRTLPISERFFSGGSATLRGFGYEEAGPRVAICPGTTSLDGNNCTPGVFRNNEGEPVTLHPFTVPVGGNALAVVNAEARVPLTRSLQVVPFYDGGNVFRRVGDIFGRNDRRPDDTLNTRNLRTVWSHTVGLGLRLRTPLGSLAVDYGFLLNPPEFDVPQFAGPPATHRLARTKIHFRFGQTF